MRISSDGLFTTKGYSFVKYTEPASTPRYVNVKFRDIVPELSSLEIGNYNLYSHQYLAYCKLGEGLNIVLRALATVLVFILVYVF
jgi:DEAD/DEAH box helicase domain-containing protein